MTDAQQSTKQEAERTPFDVSYQSLRNWTTGIVHTEMQEYYNFAEQLTGEPGLMTHHIPCVLPGIQDHLRNLGLEERFFDGEFDQTHVGTMTIDPMDDEQKAALMESFRVKIQEFWESVGTKEKAVIVVGPSEEST